MLLQDIEYSRESHPQERRRPLGQWIVLISSEGSSETKLHSTPARTLCSGGHGHHIFQADVLYQLAPALLQQTQAGPLNSPEGKLALKRPLGAFGKQHAVRFEQRKLTVESLLSSVCPHQPIYPCIHASMHPSIHPSIQYIHTYYIYTHTPLHEAQNEHVFPAPPLLPLINVWQRQHSFFQFPGIYH